ncbi:MAG: DNA-deoxyinosine glycosylase [Sphingomicrobium sp.]
MPVGRGDTRLFILGSLPGDASLAEQRYYAHPTNQFWRLVGHAIHEDLQNLPYDQRLNRLAERRIGLWDVIASATRRGSLDQAIRLADHNPVGKLLTDFPDMTALAFNGLAAASAGRRLVGSSHQLSLIDLPSSSAANTRPFAEKARAWAVLAQFVA